MLIQSSVRDSDLDGSHMGWENLEPKNGGDRRMGEIWPMGMSISVWVPGDRQTGLPLRVLGLPFSGLCQDFRLLHGECRDIHP